MLGIVLGQGQNLMRGQDVSDLVEDVDEQTEEQEANEDGEDNNPQWDTVAAFCLGPLHSRGHLGSKAGEVTERPFVLPTYTWLPLATGPRPTSHLASWANRILNFKI